jgi:rare lipoprotein A (peptidoglycan hydrolase)
VRFAVRIFFNSPAFAQNFLEGVVSIGVKLTKEETCVASQYGVGDGYHGRRTASGERFNACALLAAHKSRRFGSHVTVTNKNNGRSVRVRITDRPVHRGAASTRLEQQPTQSAWAGSRA